MFLSDDPHSHMGDTIPSSSITASENFLRVPNYSNDVESQKGQENRLLYRSHSDPSLEESLLVQDPVRSMIYHEPRRRSRSSCSRSDEELCLDGDASEKAKNRSFVFSIESACSSIRSLAPCFPSGLLLVLFLLCSYTTFFLPYPEVRPQVRQIPHLRKVNRVMGRFSNATIPMVAARSSPAMLHARAAPELELSFRPGLEQYYEQEAFSDYAWTKYANMVALGSVIVWAAIEYRRRGEFSASTQR